LTLAREGCNVAVNDIDLEGAEQTAAAVREPGRKAIAIRADVAGKAEVQGMVKKTLSETTKIDILVNNAGAASGEGLSWSKTRRYRIKISPLTLKPPCSAPRRYCRTCWKESTGR
jgi:NAD(P)-dependent dehydrogenase (short-subunit alcohol dehydrogenase family)